MAKLYVMKRFIFVMMTALVVFAAAADKQCPKCHGSGRVVTIPEVGHYGVERNKQKCPQCGQMVYSGHSCQCPQCGGTGRVAGRTSSTEREGSVSDRAAQQGIDFNTQWLTVHEYSLMQNILNNINNKNRVEDNCTACNGTGKCSQCGGVRTYTWDCDLSQQCRACGGDGFCIACRGKGVTGAHYEDVFSPEEKEKMAHNVQVCNQLAQLRASHNINPDDPAGPSLGIDSDGSYYIQNGDIADNNDNYDINSDSEDGFFSNNDSRDSDSHSGWGRIMLIGGGLAALGAGIFAFSKFRG